MEIFFEKEKETKGTIVFKEQDDNPKVGSLYLKKFASAELKNPQKMKMTLEAVE